MKKKRRYVVIRVLVIVLFLSTLLVGTSLIMFEKHSSQRIDFLKPFLTKKVQEYRPTVEKYAKQYDVEEHVDVLLAMMMQESRGRGNDPMQSSESYCGTVGCIDDPLLSIEQGVYYFSETLEAADGDLKLAIQSYNFGKGFIHYVKERTGEYSQDIAIQFSQEMYEKAEDKSIYTCLREEAKEYEACYGDIYYVRDVMQFKDMFSSK